MARVVVFDIETHSADLLYSMPPEEFVRLIGYKVDEADVVLTTSLDEIRAVLRAARFIVGHNVHAFDLKAVFGPASDEPLEMAKAGRVYDTVTHAALVNPAPYKYVNRFGQDALADSPEKAKKWFKLDEQAYQLGIRRKTDDLDALAKEYGDPELTGRARIDDGYGKIPVDDLRYREYLVGDVLASEALGKKLLGLGPLDDYAIREQGVAACAAVISSNGLRVNRKSAQARVDQHAARRGVILEDLQKRYGLPSDGAAPWDTDEGRLAILAALADYGITPDTVDWPRTPAWDNRDAEASKRLDKAKALREKVDVWREELAAGGYERDGKWRKLAANQVTARHKWIEESEAKASEIESDPLGPTYGLSMGGKELVALTKGTGAEDLGQALAELKGQRPLAQQALDHLHPDGFVHPEITMLQRSGRWSTTKPGLTTWGSRTEELLEEKEYFEADTDDEVLVEFDLSNADARAVAWMSGDTKYAVRFEPGQDGHMINAIAAWGQAVVDTNPTWYRERAKVPGHGWGYKIGAKKLAAQTGMTEEAAREFLTNMNKVFSQVVAWQKAAFQEAKTHGYVMNPWGRKMFIEKGREFTQGPALKGQSVTRELMCDALLAMPPKALRRIKAQIHDALLASVPKKYVDAWVDYYTKVMSFDLKAPPGGQPMSFPAEMHGRPAKTWREAVRKQK